MMIVRLITIMKTITIVMVNIVLILVIANQ